MFDATESIEDKYLWNFSSRDEKRFRRQHLARQRALHNYEAVVRELVATNNPAIFANYEPKPSTPFEIKYTFNRIYANDPRETELTLSHADPISSKNDPYVDTFTWAFANNTYCQTVVLNGVKMRDFWHSRGFNDDEAAQILDVLSPKKLKEFTFASYPLLSDQTYQTIANRLEDPDNRWEHVTLGKISVDEKIATALQKSGKVSFTRVPKPQKKHSSFFFINREQAHERG